MLEFLFVRHREVNRCQWSRAVTQQGLDFFRGHQKDLIIAAMLHLKDPSAEDEQAKWSTLGLNMGFLDHCSQACVTRNFSSLESIH
jgi:hypothetical protein